MTRLKPTWEWQARWASYWFGDRELFDWTARDFDRKAAILQRTGINAVITFGGFHFRWSYVSEWPRLLKALRLICSSCHRHGIRVVEHHSAILTWNPVGIEEYGMVEKHLSKLAYPVNTLRHPGLLRQWATGDACYQGVWISSMRQVDPRTGQFSRTLYHGWALCYNNPDWRRLYFRHLQDVYACGVDGIMTDDIQFFPVGYGCGCRHCRAQFNAATGCAMPRTGVDDRGFYGNLDNPAYRRWLLWRLECHRAHQQRVIEHSRRLGYSLMRPIYCSSDTNTFSSRGTGITLDNLHGLYSTVFTEVNQTDLQGHCWLRIGAESSQRRALAIRNQVPSMCLFYPHNSAENMICWGMTKSWGQRYWGTNWQLGIKAEAAMLRPTFQFEAEHARCFESLESVAEVAILFSAHTVWLHQDADQAPDYIRMSDPASTDCWAGWCEILTLANIPFDTILEDDLAERRNFDRLRLIIVPNAVCMSAKQAAALKAFVRAGGKAIVTHQSGQKTESGAWHSGVLDDLMGATYRGVVRQSPAWLSGKVNPLGVRACRAVAAPAALFKCHPGAQTWMTLKGGSDPAVFCHAFGKGEVISFAGKPGRLVCINRHERFKQKGRMKARINFHQDRALATLMEQSVRKLLQPAFQLITDGVPRGIVLGLFAQGHRLMVHMVNTAGMLADSGKTVNMPVSLKFPHAACLPGGARIMKLKVRHAGTRAVQSSPEIRGSRRLVCARQGAYIAVEIPAEYLRCYSMIVIE